MIVGVREALGGEDSEEKLVWRSSVPRVQQVGRGVVRQRDRGERKRQGKEKREEEEREERRRRKKWFNPFCARRSN